MEPPESINAGELVLKRWQPEWADVAAAAVRESLPELKPFLPWARDEYDIETARAFIMVRQVVQREHTGPFGERVRVSRPTVDRWCRWWRAGGFEALVPAPARVDARTPAEVLAMAAGLKRENPDRTAAQVVRILRAQSGWAPSERTLQRHFKQLELDRDVPPPRRCSAGSRPTGATNCGSATSCTGR
jgi:Helix-turn-helix domain